MTPWDFAEYLLPWSSRVVHDAQGNPVFDSGVPRQFFTAADGQAVRDADGNLVHLRMDNGRPVLDADGKPVCIAVEVLPEHLDYEGIPLVEMFPPGAS